MNIEIPEFLLEMAKQIREQDNRYTADPIFEVRCKRYIVTAQGYNQHGFVLQSDSEVVYRSYDAEEDELQELLLDDYPEFCQAWQQSLDNGDSVEDAIVCFDPEGDDLPDGLDLVYVQEVEETIKTCLTRADCEAFIARKQHDYPKLYIYVRSMVFCPQMIQLRNWIMGITAESGRNGTI